LVKKTKLFNNISAYSTGSLDPGMFVVSGNLNQGVDLRIVEDALNEELENIKNANITEIELDKVKHQALATVAFGEVELLNRVMNIAFAANAGDVNYCNQDKDKIEAITAEMMHKEAIEVLRSDNCSTLIYGAE
jgi:predicted Zn-dependent peptidase